MTASAPERQVPTGPTKSDETTSTAQKQARLTGWYEPLPRQVLLRRAFSLIYRLVTPWSCATSPVKSGRTQTEILSASGLLELPLLMDFCAIFGPWSPKLAADVALKAVTHRPGMLDDLSHAARAVFAPNLQQVMDRSVALFHAITQEDGDVITKTHSELLESVAYLYDFAASLYLTVACTPYGTHSVYVSLYHFPPSLLCD